MALTITGFLLLPSAFFEPLIYLRLAGVNSDANLLKGIMVLLLEHEIWVAGLVFWCAVLAPVGLLLGIFALASGLAKRWHILAPTLKAVEVFRHWAMLEVYIVSLLVALFADRHRRRAPRRRTVEPGDPDAAQPDPADPV